MSDRERIIEAMAEALHGDSCPEDPDEGESCSCGSWQREAETALDAALPLIREALADKVRDGIHTVEMAWKAVRAGMSVGEVRAWDEALAEAALLIEEVEL